MHRGNVGGSVFLRPVMSLHFSKNIYEKKIIHAFYLLQKFDHSTALWEKNKFIHSYNYWSLETEGKKTAFRRSRTAKRPPTGALSPQEGPRQEWRKNRRREGRPKDTLCGFSWCWLDECLRERAIFFYPFSCFSFSFSLSLSPPSSLLDREGGVEHNTAGFFFQREMRLHWRCGDSVGRRYIRVINMD